MPKCCEPARGAAAILFLSLAACSRQAPAPPMTRLEALIGEFPASPACSREIPIEWSTSWPVPALEGKRLIYRVFFFRREGTLASGFRFLGPEGTGAFTPDGQVVECRRRPSSTPLASAPLRSNAPGELARTVARAGLLYAATEDVARLYAAGRPPSSDEKTRVAAYGTLLQELAVSEHAAAYRALSPAFWEWMDANGAATLRTR